MREIKFRGKSISNGEWLKGYSYLYCHKYFGSGEAAYFIPNIYGDKQGRMVDKNTLGQYIGIKDKNGNEIYEGDIVIADFDYKKEAMEVIYFKCGFKLKSKNCKEPYDYSIHDETPELEVIGNMYENPNLLEEKNG